MIVIRTLMSNKIYNRIKSSDLNKRLNHLCLISIHKINEMSSFQKIIIYHNKAYTNSNIMKKIEHIILNED